MGVLSDARAKAAPIVMPSKILAMVPLAAAHGCHCRQVGARSNFVWTGRCALLWLTIPRMSAAGKMGRSRPSCIQLTASCLGTLRRRRGATPWYPREPKKHSARGRVLLLGQLGGKHLAARLLGRPAGAAHGMALAGKTANGTAANALPNCSLAPA